MCLQNERIPSDTTASLYEDMPSVAIVVLAWNQCRLTLECLESLSAVRYPAEQLEIIVVDNGSADNTVEELGKHYPSVTLIANKKNLGYAGGNNVGIRYALTREVQYICVLNNDVVVDPEFLLAVVSTMEENQEVGVCTPLVAEMRNPEIVWALGSGVDWKTGAVHRLHAGDNVSKHRFTPPFSVDIASGAAMCIRREVFERVGCLDEAFYLYYEESDWCLRAKASGYRILAVPVALVWHKVFGTVGETSPLIDYYMLRNHLRFIARNWSGIARVRLLALVTLRNLITISAYTLKSHQGHRIPYRNARLFALRDATLGRWGRANSPATAPSISVDQ